LDCSAIEEKEEEYDDDDDRAHTILLNICARVCVCVCFGIDKRDCFVHGERVYNSRSELLLLLSSSSSSS
jgi:hypothetical protein